MKVDALIELAAVVTAMRESGDPVCAIHIDYAAQQHPGDLAAQLDHLSRLARSRGMTWAVPEPVTPMTSATDDAVTVQVQEPAHRLRSINDPRLNIPEPFRKVWQALYRRAKKRNDRIVTISISRLGELAGVPATETVSAALRFLDSIGAVVVVIAPKRERNRWGEVKTSRGRYKVPRAEDLDREELTQRIAALPADARLTRPRQARLDRKKARSI